jgi:hypothetical protein
MNLLPLRPSIKNPRYWFPDRPIKSKWRKIRAVVLGRDKNTCRFCGHTFLKFMQMHHLKESDDNSRRNLVTCCVACHAVQHIGRNLELGIIEIWKSPFSQVDIVHMSREAIRAGKSLKMLKRSLKLTRGTYPPQTPWNTQTRSSNNGPKITPFTSMIVYA